MWNDLTKAIGSLLGEPGARLPLHLLEGWVGAAARVSMLAYTASALWGLLSGIGWVYVGTEAAVVVLCGVALHLVGRGEVYKGTWLMLYGLWLQLHVAIAGGGSMLAVPIVTFPVLVLGTGVALGSLEGFALAVSLMFTVPCAAWVLSPGPFAPDPEAGRIVLVFGASVIGTAALVHLGLQAFARAFRAATHSEALLADAIANVPHAMVVYDDEDRIAYYNERFVEAYPALRGMIKVGVTFKEMLEAARVRGLLVESRDAAGMPPEEEWLLAHELADGAPSVRPVAGERTLLAQEYRTRDGGVLSVGTDITELMEREEILRASEERFRSIIAALPAAFCLKDAEGRYLVVNDAFEQWIGVSQTEVLGRTASDLFPPDVAAWVDGERAKLFETQERVHSERSVDIGSMGERILASTTFPVRGANREIIGVGTIDVDVTEQRTAEARLRRSHRMEAVGQLTGGIAHDFNNLLTVIIGGLELAVTTDDRQRVERLVRTSLDASEKAAQLTSRLLAFSSQQALQTRSVDVNSLVEGMEGLLVRTLGAEVRVERELADDIWTCRADAGQLENAILNLAINARDAIESNGVITIGTRNRTVDASECESESDDEHPLQPGDFVEVAVSDDGVGISERDLARVLEPFFTTKEVGEGSGLGLSMVFGFARQSGGHLQLESEVGVGTTVRLLLPRTAKPASEPETREPSALPKGSGRILVVEDDPNVRRYAVDVLQTLGYSVVAAEDGPTAVELLEEEPELDLVFTDVVLPSGMSGRDIADHVRSVRPETPVLFTSGYAFDVLTAKGRLHEDVELLPKPYTPEELAEKVREVLAAQSAV